MTITQTSSGELRYKIIRADGSIEQSDWIHNLRLPRWRIAYLREHIDIAKAGLYRDTKKTIVKPTGTASVSFDTGSGKWQLTASADSNIDFIDHVAGDRIKFLNGDDVMISATLDSKTVELASYNAKDISAQEFRVYRTGIWPAGHFGTPSGLGCSNGSNYNKIDDVEKGEESIYYEYNSYVNSSDSTVIVDTITFGGYNNPDAAQGYADTITSVVNLPTSISILPGDQMTFEYRVYNRLAGYPNPSAAVIDSISGGGFPYADPIASISSDGTEVTITTTEPHYREVDDKLKIKGTLNFDSDDDDPTNPWSWRVSAKVDDNTLTVLRTDAGAVPVDGTTEAVGTFEPPSTKCWIVPDISMTKGVLNANSSYYNINIIADLFPGIPTYNTVVWSAGTRAGDTTTSTIMGAADDGFNRSLTFNIPALNTDCNRIGQLRIQDYAYKYWQFMIVFEHAQRKPYGYTWTFNASVRYEAELPWN